MFGYVIPDKSKLTEAQWHGYRAAYCGLCRTLRQRYGFWAQFLLNYDFTFLALLLRQAEDEPCVRCRHCIAHPIRGRNACEGDPALEAAADCSVLLVYWKLRDQLQDEKGIKRFGAKAILVLLGGLFRRAKAKSPDLDQRIGALLGELQDLEREGCPSLDRTADRFAQIMTAMVPSNASEARRRELEQLLYHLGRWIYLVDAWDDMDDDLNEGHYNPVARRFAISVDACDEKRCAAKEQVERTLQHSENLAIAAFHLGDFGWDAPIIENILCAGLSGVRKLVLSGQWKQIHKQKKQELKHL